MPRSIAARTKSFALRPPPAGSRPRRFPPRSRSTSCSRCRAGSREASRGAAKRTTPSAVTSRSTVSSLEVAALHQHRRAGRVATAPVPGDHLRLVSRRGNAEQRRGLARDWASGNRQAGEARPGSPRGIRRRRAHRRRCDHNGVVDEERSRVPGAEPPGRAPPRIAAPR